MVWMQIFGTGVAITKAMGVACFQNRQILVCLHKAACVMERSTALPGSTREKPSCRDAIRKFLGEQNIRMTMKQPYSNMKH